MTNEEAIESLEIEQNKPRNIGCEMWVALDIAIEALEKQIPKKPLNTQTEGLYSAEFDFSCPNCKVWITGVDKDNFQRGHKQDYCECCGQALDWE